LFFQEHGYIVLQQAISKSLLDAFKETLGKLVDVFFIVSVIQRIVSRTPEFFSLSSCINTMPWIKSIYGLDEKSPVYIINNGIVFTCPDDKNNKAVSNFETNWHNDIFYTIPKSHFWQVWVPLLHNATIEIGTLIICPGSHKDKNIKQQIDINAK